MDSTPLYGILYRSEIAAVFFVFARGLIYKTS